MILSTEKLDMPGIVVVVHNHNSSNQEASAGGSQVWGQPELHSELQDHLEQLGRSCLKANVRYLPSLHHKGDHTHLELQQLSSL